MSRALQAELLLAPERWEPPCYERHEDDDDPREEFIGYDEPEEDDV